MKRFIKYLLISVSVLLFSTFTVLAGPLKVGLVYLTTPGDHGWT